MRRSLLAVVAAIAFAGTLACGVARAQALVVDTRTPRVMPAPADGADVPDEQRPIDATQAEMPWVHGGRPGVAARINDAVYLQLIESLAPRTPGATYTTPPPPHPSLGYAFCELHFSVERNDGRVLSLKMALEYRGQGHCSDGDQVFHFDAATGRQLHVEGLLTPAGQATLIEQFRAAAVANYDRLLATLPPDPEDADADPDSDAAPAVAPPSPPQSEPDDPSNDEQRRFFKSCRGHWEGPGPEGEKLVFELPAASGLVVPSSQCAGNRREMLMDTPPEPLVVTDAHLEPLLTPYGRRLLLGKGTAPAPAALFGQTLRGHVGTAAVTLHLGAAHGNFGADAVYAYDRIGTAIALSGQWRGETLELREDADGTGFTLHQEGSVLVGVWHGKGKRLPVRLE